jgi:hypothetical protein
VLRLSTKELAALLYSLNSIPENAVINGSRGFKNGQKIVEIPELATAGAKMVEELRSRPSAEMYLKVQDVE